MTNRVLIAKITLESEVKVNLTVVCIAQHVNYSYILMVFIPICHIGYLWKVDDSKDVRPKL